MDSGMEVVKRYEQCLSASIFLHPLFLCYTDEEMSTRKDLL